MDSQSKKLYRSKNNRIIAGVAGGLGNYFEVDPILIRAVFILFTLVSGFGILLYLILILLIPEEPNGANPNLDKDNYSENGSRITKSAQEAKRNFQSVANQIKINSRWLKGKRDAAGIAFTLIGLFALGNQLLPHWFNWALIWPMLIILIGLYILSRGRGV
jgi:phage shock protein C